MKDLKQNELIDFVSKGNSVIDFWATWCGPCKMLLPVFDELGKEMNDVKFAKADIDIIGEEAIALGIRGVPTLLFFKDGKEISRISGFMPKDVLKSKIQEVFK